MDIRELKNYIYENKYVEQILYSIGCHHIKYHSSKDYWSCANATGDNNNAIILYNNEYLMCTNYTRQMIDSSRGTDILDLVCYTKNITFFECIKYICDEMGISYYHNFEDNIPECFKILDMLESMDDGYLEEKEKPLIPISEHILNYYFPYVNDLFKEDNISYSTQKDFEIGFDPETNRYTIPIRSEIGDLVGIKGRYFDRKVPDGFNKYIYLEPCAKSKILYGLHKTMPYITREKRVYVVESEKGVLQLWDMGVCNVVSTGGKQLSQKQIDMLTRLGVEVVFCFDKDVTKVEIEELSKRFLEGISIGYIYDEDNILEEKESPSDNPQKWKQLCKNNIYKMR